MGIVLVTTAALAIGAIVGLLARVRSSRSPAGSERRVARLHWAWFVAAPPLVMYLSASGTWLARVALGINNYGFGSLALLIPLMLVCWVPFLGLWAISARILGADADANPVLPADDKRASVVAGLAAGLLGIAFLAEQGIASGNPAEAVELSIFGAPFVILGFGGLMGLASFGASLALGLTAGPLGTKAPK
jgi:hypothetical protein